MTILAREFELTLALMGCRSVADITATSLLATPGDRRALSTP
jgi:isopentenyl diphosphate isomerase/L-lactate dehydrogenase-like FMN-dependent dehydrogenase